MWDNGSRVLRTDKGYIFFHFPLFLTKSSILLNLGSVLFFCSISMYSIILCMFKSLHLFTDFSIERNTINRNTKKFGIIDQSQIKQILIFERKLKCPNRNSRAEWKINKLNTHMTSSRNWRQACVLTKVWFYQRS